MGKTSELYVPHRKYPALFGDEFQETWLHPDMIKLVQAFKSASSEADVHQISPLLRQESDQVYSFNCLSPLFMEQFNKEIVNFYEAAETHSIPVKRPNSMNNYGVIVNEIGMRSMIDSLQQRYLHPLASRLFPNEASKFDAHHSFLVRYQADEDLGLDMHTDDSDVTFNVCLGHDFTGATLSFCGDFGSPEHRKHSQTYAHEIGRAVMHLGTRRHGADDIATGTRQNLIVWNHNHDWRASEDYTRIRTVLYEKEDEVPDGVCLSYTHDRDYEFYKELPSHTKGKRLTPWCPPRGKEYDEFERKRLEHSPMGDL